MIKKSVFKITGMHCTSCAMNIDGELEDTDGVLEARTNYVKQETAVVFDEKKLTEKRISNIIQKAGYTGVPVKN